jgi:hypothetical protein
LCLVPVRIRTELLQQCLLLFLGLPLRALHCLLDTLDYILGWLLVRLVLDKLLDVEDCLLPGGVLVVAHGHVVVRGARVETRLHIDVLVWGVRVLNEGVA